MPSSPTMEAETNANREDTPVQLAYTPLVQCSELTPAG